MVKASWLVGAATCRPHDRRESLHEYPSVANDRFFLYFRNSLVEGTQGRLDAIGLRAYDDKDGSL
jgi:hypothetical protein